MDCISPEKLRGLWKQYSAARAPYLSATTLSRDYAKIEKRLARLPAWVTSSGDVLEWLTSHYSPETSRRTLQQIKACCNWAAEHRYLNQDPFKTIPNLPDRKTKTITAPAHYSSQESRAILRALKPHDGMNYRWGSALLLTGARPEELRALKIKDWNQRIGTLCFARAFPMEAKSPQGTKNGLVTPDFPVEKDLAAILASAAKNGKPDRWLFLGQGDNPFNYTTFQRNVWGPIVEDLAASGTISCELSQYHARHSWITRQLAAGLSIQDVAYLSRTSPRVILSTYAQRARSIKISGL